MTKKLKPQRITLPEEVSKAVLDAQVSFSDGSQRTIREVLEEAALLTERANRELRSNALVSYLAKSLARENNLRGDARIQVSQEEGPYLVVGSEDPTRPERLPSLEELRERAAAMGVEVDDLGRQKLKILERLNAHDPEAPQFRADERGEGLLPYNHPRIPR